ncbi:hypothetical protein, conserved [Babesia ovata]|uniref:Extracellular matrix-binding ebh n=1 Tax=Babesia ovata TaxID=189622 RepID=A0A2H6KAF8_9APIC|nr:uncharacterized protein BOVATA_014800 [Babesia ovata]GBE59987.1 hypothetical protein, conserved [Babesia ovata]
MAFLHGVLKDVHAKQPYNVGKNTLNGVVENLFENLCSGHEGFKRVIEKVAQGVGGYNREVERSNRDVKSKITDLDSQMTNILTGVKAILPKPDKNVQDPAPPEPTADQINGFESKISNMVQRCKDHARAFNSAILKAKDKIKDLNDQTEEKVNKARERIDIERGRFDRACSHEKNEFNEMAKKIESVLREHGENINLQIKKDVEKLVAEIKKLVNKILDQIRTIDRCVETYANDLETRMRDAEKIVKEVGEKVDKILEEVDKNGKHKIALKAAANMIRQHAYSLWEAGDQAKEIVQRDVGAALKQVLVLDRAVRKGLKTTKDNIKGAMQRYVKEQLLGDIQKRVGEIINGTSQNGLSQMVRVFKEHALKFSKRHEHGFDGIVKQWIVEILNEDKTVGGYIGQYVTTNESRLSAPYKMLDDLHGIYKALNERIATGITEKLEAEISQAVLLADVSDGGTEIEEYVQAVQVGCNLFAKEIAQKIKADEGRYGHTLADNIAKEVETGGSNQEGITETRRETGNAFFLTHAIQVTLHQLIGVAKKAGAAVGSFTGDDDGSGSDITSVNAALTVAQLLEKDLGTATEDNSRTTVQPIPPGDDEDGRRKYEYDARILGILEQEIGTEEDNGGGSNGDKIQRVKDTEFKVYDRSIKQDKVSTGQLTGEKGEGQLPEAIGEISREVTNALKNIDNLDTQAKEQLDHVNKHLNSLCQAITSFAETGDDSAKKKITELRKKIGTTLKDEEKSLHRVHQNLVSLRKENLKKAINDVEKFLQEGTGQADTAGRETIAKLREQVEEKVRDTTSKLTTQAKKHYVSSIKTAIQYFAARVQNELRGLAVQIENDLKEGYKGFMNKCGAHLIPKLDPIKGVPQTVSKGQKSPLSQAAEKFNEAFAWFYGALINQSDSESDVKKIKPSQNPLTNLLEGLVASQHFNSEFSKNLVALNNKLERIKPSNHNDGKSPFQLETLKNGFTPLVKELDKAYVNRYSGIPFADELVKDDKITGEGTNAAKIFLTILMFYCDDLTELHKQCTERASWWGRQIYASTKGDENLLADFFVSCGYKVPSGKDKQDGELQRSLKMTGSDILGKLNAEIQNSHDNEHLKHCKPNGKKFSFNIVDITKCIFNHVHDYYRCCHFVVHPKPKHPSSIYDMLTWLSGLTYNPVHHELTLNGFPQLFEKPKKEASADDENDGASIKLVADDTLEAYPKAITAMGLSDTLTDVCHKSHAVLIAILGYGHSGGVYACDFNTNPQGFSYPAHFNALVCMLFDFLKRIHQQLYFLYDQCNHTTAMSGWRDCHYGRNVAGSSWQCNTNQCANLDCPQKAGQNANQSGNQKARQKAYLTCDQHPTCGVKSPLQSFLEDSLVGFLPHVLTSGRGISCLTCTKTSSGMPCKTPMGFAEIGITASHSHTGQHISDILGRFIGKKSSPLTMLLSQLRCVLPSAPKTVADLLSFYFNLFNGWEKQSDTHRKVAFDDAVNEANFKSPYSLNDVSLIFKSKDHSLFVYGDTNTGKTLYHNRGDLHSIHDPANTCYTPGITCGAYVSTLCHDTYSTFSSKHKGLYLSWIVFLTEYFYDLLSQLCKKCDAICAAKHKKCRITGCAYGVCNLLKSGYVDTFDHSATCNSIIRCPKSLTSLYECGLTFGNRKHLDGYVENKCVPKRTCQNFIDQLTKVCSDGSVLSQLIHKTIPEFLWKIRQPFSYLLLALWSLSLLYLLHITVVRLDVLRIRSHLRSPSSHRIAAQSLLAAARVKALANVKYFSP